MEHGDYEDIKRCYEAFVKQSALEVIIPNTKDDTADSLIRKQAEQLKRTPSRTHIFFDEVTTACIVLRSSVSQQVIEDLLPYLELNVSAHATNAAADGAADTAPIASKHELVVVRRAATEGHTTVKIGTATHAAWSQSMHVARPRARLQRPAVYFTATLTLRAAFLEHALHDEKHFLPSYQASPINVLESLKLSPAPGRVYLSEARITKISPASPQLGEAIQALRGVTKRAYLAVPAIIPRLRCSAVSDKIFVSLLVEASQILAGNVTIREIKFEVSGAAVECIGDIEKSPTLQPGDELALVYRVVQTRTTGRSITSGITSIVIEATVSLSQGTECELKLAWQTQIDLSKESSTAYCSWSKDKPTSNVPPQPDLQVSSAVAFDFTAPRTTAVGGSFDLDVRCVNNTKRARQFAVKVDKGQQRALSNAIASSPDIRLGPVEPAECFEAAIKYAALACGVLDLGQVRIVDLDTNDSIKVLNLPDVVAH